MSQRGRLRTVGRYELIEVIGRGGAAVVYLAHQRDLGRAVALKELSPQIAGDPSFAKRFVEESRVAGSMNHPSIVTVHEYFEFEGQPYIAMEYLPRGSLRGHIGRLTLAQVAGVLEDVLAGLGHGESRGVVHRDLKPENLLVDADGRAKIGDFGVARAYNQAAPRGFVTATGTTIGTPAYMAPEQALGGRLTPATDLYSLGIVVWEALAGQPPFAGGETPVALLYRQVHEPVPPITGVRPDLDRRVAQWLERILRKAPEDRFQSARQAWEAFEDIAIELLGPRWRREACIRESARDGAGASAQGRRAAPTVSGPSAQGRRVTPTVSGPSAQGRRVTPTVSEADPAVAGARTVMEPARRHRSREEPRDVSGGGSRGWLRIALGGLAALIVAVAAGAAAGELAGGGARTRTRTLPAASHPGAAAALLAPVIGRLAQRRAAALRELARARTRAAQAGAASTLAGDYGAAALALAHGPDPGVTGAIATELDGLAAGWRRLAADARAGRRAAYESQARSIVAAQRRLSARLSSISG